MLTLSQTQESIVLFPAREYRTVRQSWHRSDNVRGVEESIISSGRIDVEALSYERTTLLSYTASIGAVVSDATWEFRQLVASWRKERGATSSITKMAMCPSYQRIIAKGELTIPLILREMEIEDDEPDQWFWALAVITGADPVPDEARGDIIQMAKAWLDWGRSRYAW
jgi:hypothetical protein